MRHTANLNIPVMDLPWQYQHRYQLKQYLAKRDKYTSSTSRRWQSSEVDFAATVHPIPTHYTGSFWKAARRSSILFDWMGHGQNVQKRHKRMNAQTLPTIPLLSPCNSCGQHDNQAHIMLTCTNPLLTPIRIAARVHQATLATKLLRESTTPTERHFIEKFTMDSWLSSSPTTERLWTGMWTQDILRDLLPPDHDMLSPMGRADRIKYRRIASLLTQPLLTAYKQMICTRIHSPSHSPLGLTRPSIPSLTHHRTSLLIHQSSQPTKPYSLDSLYMSPNASQTAYAYSDAAFYLTDADIGTRLNHT
jgi:hypothetical protein